LTLKDLSSFPKKDSTKIKDIQDLDFELKYKILLARALYTQANLVIIDNIIDDIDSEEFAEMIGDILRWVSSNTQTILINTRSRNIIQKVEKILVINEGSVESCYDVEQLLRNIE